MNSKTQFWEDLRTGKFASMVKENSKGRYLSNSKEAYHILKPIINQDCDVEKVYAIYMNTKNRILAIEKVFSGTITGAAIYPRELIKRAIQLKATAFILAHNHPSGDPTPSLEDKSITLKIGIAAASIDVSFHDHIIIGDGYHSLADSGWMRQVSTRFSEIIKAEIK